MSINVNKFMHIWAYKDLKYRTEARERFSEIGWPPKSEAKPPIKMENKISSPSSGTIDKICVKEGQTIKTGQTLFILKK